MNSKIRISSIITMLTLCFGSILEALQPLGNSSMTIGNYRLWVTVISYIGVYAIVLWLVSNNAVVKIILTLINIFAALIALTFAASGVMNYHGLVAVLLVIVGIVGVIAGIYAVIVNNRFAKPETDQPDESSDSNQS